MALSSKFRLKSRVPAYSRAAPELQTPPSLLGTVATGGTLTAVPGVYSNGPYTIRRQWTRDGVDIEDATDQNYPIQDTDLGTTLAYREYAFHAGGQSAPTTISAGVVTASDPIFPLTQTVTWGAQTPKGYGAHPLAYKGTGTLSITSGNSSGVWAISTAAHVMGANRLITSGTYGSAAPAFAAGYTLVVTDGVYTCTVTVQMRDNEISTARWQEVDAVARRVGGIACRFGDVISVRDGAVAQIQGSKVSQYTQRSGGPAAPTSHTDAGWVTIKPDAGATTGFGSCDITGEYWYLRMQNCGFRRYNTSGAQASSFGICRFRNGALKRFWFDRCEFYSRVETGTAATSTNIATAIVSIGCSEIYLTDNDIHDCFRGISGDGSNWRIVGNRIYRAWEDALYGSFRDSDILFNHFFDKQYAAGAHGDFFQQGWNYAQGTFVGNRVVGNVFCRGSGYPSAPDGQGIFWQRFDGGTNFTVTNDRIYGNLILCSKGNGIDIAGRTNGLVKWNTVVFGAFRDIPTGGGNTIQICRIRDTFGSVSTGEIAYNICMTFDGAAGVTQSNNLTTATDLSDYATIFADPVRDSASDIPTLEARWAPKVGGPADGTIKTGAVTPYINRQARTWAFPDGFSGSA